ncbi:MAG: nicotinate phosphoribosyltransferase [Armatimonadetes bacterium]|nr:nicotinate phosphoribosyltransferase [Armatimonadota bacterium]
MSIFDNRRIPAETFKLDVERMRHGWYADKYFANIVTLLTGLAREGYAFGGHNALLADADSHDVRTGDIEVEMQWFTRRRPASVVVGVDKALAMLKECTGYFDDYGAWVSTYDRLEVRAVQDGFVAPYEGDPRRVTPILKVRGRYRDFAALETPTLGALTRTTRVATNVYEVLKAAGGKPVLFFPARFDAHEVQAGDGYAYHIAVQLFNRTYGQNVVSAVSTDEQGDWWGGAGGGTVAHAAIACFLGDTPETVLQFARLLPPHIPRIALVDFNNDCVGDSLRTMKVLFQKHMELENAGKHEEAQKYVLYGVRPDTGGNLMDKSLEPLGDKKLDRGVNARLVFKMRREMDHAYEAWDVPFPWLERAKAYCKNVKITVTGGFTPAKIREFEENGVPADVYGVGSYLLSNSSADGTNNDFTADIVRVKLNGQWRDMAKVGRAPADNPALQPVNWEEI